MSGLRAAFLRRVAGFAALLLAACSRADRNAALDAGASGAPSSGASSSPSAMVAPSSAPLAPSDGERGRSTDADASTYAEARRSRVAHPDRDPLLASYAAPLRAHFGAAFTTALSVQIAPLGEGRSAMLVTRDGSNPFVLVADAEHHVLWQMEQPAGGIVPPVGDLAIASGPRARVMLAACDPPTSTVAMREWNDDASPVGDFHVLDVDGCESLSLLRWPGHGWLVVAWRAGVARAQLQGERGTRAWGEGKDLGVIARTGVPGAVIVDGPGSIVLVQRAPLPGGQVAYAPLHVLATRYDASGTALFPAPIDLGTAPAEDAGTHGPRIELDRAPGTEGEIVVRLGGHSVGLTSRGETRGSF